MARRRETLDDLLDAAGLGPTKAAELAGISPRALLDWRKGIHKPRAAELARLAKVLGVDPARIRAAIRNGA